MLDLWTFGAEIQTWGDINPKTISLNFWRGTMNVGFKLGWHFKDQSQKGEYGQKKQNISEHDTCVAPSLFCLWRVMLM